MRSHHTVPKLRPGSTCWGPCRLGVPWTKGRRRGPRDVTSQRELVEKRVGEGVSRAPPKTVVGPENRTQDLRTRSQSLYQQS